MPHIWRTWCPLNCQQPIKWLSAIIRRLTGTWEWFTWLTPGTVRGQLEVDKSCQGYERGRKQLMDVSEDLNTGDHSTMWGRRGAVRRPYPEWQKAGKSPYRAWQAEKMRPSGGVGVAVKLCRAVVEPSGDYMWLSKDRLSKDQLDTNLR